MVEPFRPAVARHANDGGPIGKRDEKRNVVVAIDLTQRQRVVRSEENIENNYDRGHAPP